MPLSLYGKSALKGLSYAWKANTSGDFQAAKSAATKARNSFEELGNTWSAPLAAGAYFIPFTGAGCRWNAWKRFSLCTSLNS